MLIPFLKHFQITESLISHKDKCMAFPTKNSFMPANNQFLRKCISTLLTTELLFGNVKHHCLSTSILVVLVFPHS